MRWTVGSLLLLLLVGCSIRPVEQPPLDEVELEEAPLPRAGFGLWNQGLPLYSTEGWIPAHYYRDEWSRPMLREGAYDPREDHASPSTTGSETSIALPQRAPERHLSERLSSPASSNRSQRFLRERERRPTEAHKGRSAVERASRQRQVEEIRRQRQEAKQKAKDEEERADEEASRRRNARAKFRP